MTSATVTIYNEEGNPIVRIYKHCDGDLLGKELKEKFGKYVIVNGINDKNDEKYGKWANGMDELAAIIVMELKREAGRGDIYLIPPCDDDDEDDVTFDIDYQYEITFRGYGRSVKIEGWCSDCDYDEDEEDDR